MSQNIYNQVTGGKTGPTLFNNSSNNTNPFNLSHNTGNVGNAPTNPAQNTSTNNLGTLGNNKKTNPFPAMNQGQGTNTQGDQVQMGGTNLFQTKNHQNNGGMNEASNNAQMQMKSDMQNKGGNTGTNNPFTQNSNPFQKTTSPTQGSHTSQNQSQAQNNQAQGHTNEQKNQTQNIQGQGNPNLGLNNQLNNAQNSQNSQSAQNGQTQNNNTNSMRTNANHNPFSNNNVSPTNTANTANNTANNTNNTNANNSGSTSIFNNKIVDSKGNNQGTSSVGSKTENKISSEWEHKLKGISTGGIVDEFREALRNAYASLLTISKEVSDVDCRLYNFRIYHNFKQLKPILKQDSTRIHQRLNQIQSRQKHVFNTLKTMNRQLGGENDVHQMTEHLRDYDMSRKQLVKVTQDREAVWMEPANDQLKVLFGSLNQLEQEINHYSQIVDKFFINSP